MSLQTVLWIVALILFILAAFPLPARVNLVAIGLAFLTAGFLVPALT